MLIGASQVAQLVNNQPAIQETQDRLLGWEDPLEKGMAIHLSILPAEFHGQRSLAGYSPWGHKRVGHDLVTKQQQTMFHCMHTIFCLSMYLLLDAWVTSTFWLL